MLPVSDHHQPRGVRRQRVPSSPSAPAAGDVFTSSPAATHAAKKTKTVGTSSAVDDYFEGLDWNDIPDPQVVVAASLPSASVKYATPRKTKAGSILSSIVRCAEMLDTSSVA